MLRTLYSAAFTLAQPALLARLFWRARRQPEYRQHIGERWGHYAAWPTPVERPPLLWLHAVSVGETRAAAPVIDALLAAHPQHTLLLTHMTPTGRAAGAELLTRHPGRIVQAYLPYDLPGPCKRFFAHFRPQRGLIMETELWPNLCAAAAAQRVPLALVNARLSARSAAGYARVRGLIAPALASLSVIAAQAEADAERLRRLGAPRVVVCGNLKFDVTPDAAARARGARWKQRFVDAHGNARPVLLAASTRDGEESLLLDALAPWLKQPATEPSPLLLLVPRHPQRFDDVAALVRARGFTLARRSALPPETTQKPSEHRAEKSEAIATLAPDVQVWLGDSMGEMAAYYAAADLAVMGGSLLPFGGQNLIEAAACGCPTLVGPHTFNFAQAAADAIDAGAARRVRGLDEAQGDAPGGAADATANANDPSPPDSLAGSVSATLATLAPALLADPAALARMRECAHTFSHAHQGATARTLAAVFATDSAPANGRGV
ncbi:3-deoxy-D-manno-octulosonic acid transferase [Rhodocyclus tenuis]|uniref:3-deoxy-D-manno-octulosonic acid transferase n=1 Tax=Rhodocyclus gracilis TaxID=2929842 RepID=A0ABX0WJ93_9RHOO|nr:lipid IV(A) 3-deoxy-D-manno-octulosonic acid transferase [Rhodocyclus gracilis]NJA89627.1 3-deoxy-D-manno-octulosonic acid transferase [Rhodocyclus gracilis]